MGSAQWEKLLTYPGISRRLFGACQWNNRIIIAGGINSAGTYLNDVWESVNGIEWNKLATGVQSFSARAGHVLLVHNQRLYIIGGYDGSSYLSDTWTSEDGTTWDRVSNSQFNARAYHAAYSFNQGLYLAGGYDGSTYFDDAWKTIDGSLWERITNGYAYLQRTYASFKVFNNRMFLIGGYDGTTYYNTATHSNDGRNAEITGSTCGLPNAYSMGCEIFDKKLVVSGGYGYASQGNPAGVLRKLFYSSDGILWYTGIGDIGEAVYQHQMVALKEPQRLFLLFGYSGSAVIDDIWVSTGNWQG